jgi:hypothetical protein
VSSSEIFGALPLRPKRTSRSGAAAKAMDQKESCRSRWDHAVRCNITACSREVSGLSKLQNKSVLPRKQSKIKGCWQR